MIDQSVVSRVLSAAMADGADFAEVFGEDVQRSSAVYDDGRIETLASSRDRGVGIRVVTDGSTGFAHTTDLTEAGLLRAAQAASAAVGQRLNADDPDLAASDPGESTQRSAPPSVDEPTAGSGSDSHVDTVPSEVNLADVIPVEVNPADAVPSEVNLVDVVPVEVNPADAVPAEIELRPEEVAKQDKVELLRAADRAARAVDESISQVTVSYSDARRRILVANTEGVYTADDQTRTTFSVNCVATGDTGQQTGRESVGHTVGFELFNRHRPEEIAVAAAERAVTKLNARPAPSGTFPVVIGPGSGGVLFHEACGHGLEADLVRKGASVFAGKVGEKVASELVTLIDDGTMSEEWGRFAVDDEGRPARHNVLIERGVLVDYMWDGDSAREAGRESSGNGRRQSYRHLPMVRMSNTYLEGGESDPADIIAGVDYGVYVARLGGGQVNTASGDFVFGMTEAYLIENGEVTVPLREGQLIGNGPKVLQLIDAVGNDFEMGPPGTCGKDGQGVPVGDGVPTLRVAELTVGGTA